MTPAELEVVEVVIGCAAAAAIAVALGRRSRAREPRRPGLRLALLMLLAFASYATLALLKLRAYNMGAEDLGRVDQAIWSVLHRRPLVFSASEVGRPMSRLAGHVELLYVPLAPLFLVWDSAGVLLVAQALAVALGAWPAFRLGERAGGAGLGLGAALAYLAHPAVGNAALADVHGDTFAMPLLLLALERALAGRRLTSFVALALAVAAKEYAALLAITTGLYLLVARRERRLGAAAIALGLLWLALVVPALHARYRPDDFPELTSLYFSRLGATPGEVARTALLEPWRLAGEILTPRKLGVMAMLVAPLGLAPLACPTPLLLALPVFLPLAATEQLDLRNHHNATLVPFLLLAAVGGARRLAGARAASLLLAATSVAHLTIGPSPFSVRSWTPGRWDYLGNPHVAGRTLHDRVLDQAVALVPREARVTASGHVVPHLAHREVCFAFPAPPLTEAIDIALVDLVGSHPPGFRPRSGDIARLEELLADPAFTLTFARDGVFLLVRREGTGPPTPLPPLAPSPPRPAGGPPPAGRFAIGPLVLAVEAGGGLAWEAARPIGSPLVVLDADTRAVRLVPSTPSAPLPWRPGERVPDPEPFPAGRRLVVLALEEGFPALDPRDPPQPWLPDPYRGERLLPASSVHVPAP